MIYESGKVINHIPDIFWLWYQFLSKMYKITDMTLQNKSSLQMFKWYFFTRELGVFPLGLFPKHFALCVLSSYISITMDYNRNYAQFQANIWILLFHFITPSQYLSFSCILARTIKHGSNLKYNSWDKRNMNATYG